MKIIKNIHNNISLCLDSRGNEVIAFGKGIGFKKPPYDLHLKEVERTFYNINPIYIETLAKIPEDVIEVSSAIIDYANKLLHGNYSNNLIFTLADHINFSIERKKKNISINLPMYHEVRHMYPDEIAIGDFALKHINDKLGISLPKEEAAVITLHVIEYGINSYNQQENISKEQVVERCIDIVEINMKIKIDKEGFNYSRFVSHMYFLLNRINKKKSVDSDNKNIFTKIVEEYPSVYECSKELAQVVKVELSEEELLYLMLHINRLISREV